MELSVQAFDRICRVCLTESSNMTSLFTKLNGGHELLDLLIFTVNVQANSDDGLPKQVCGDCEAFIHKADEFKRRCIESEMILKNLYQNSCNQYFVKTDENLSKTEVKMDFCENKPSNYEGELEKPDLLSLFSNSDISFKKLDVPNDEKHTVKKEIVVEYENNDYSNDFDDREELVMIPIEFKQEKAEIKTYKCVCGQEYKNTEKYRQHLKMRKCIKYKKRAKRRAKSNKTFIPIKNELSCSKCNQTFDVVTEWSAHQETHFNDTENIKITEVLPQFQCSLCLRKFKNKKSLSKHIKRHETTDNVKYTCSKCKREFKYKAFLESHMLSVHVNATDGFMCEFCPEKFSSKKSLQIHTDNHKKKKNACPFCDKSFLLLCTLKDHLRIHTGEKPFLCSVCGKGFSQKTNLGQHMRRHMGVKPFKCDSCAMGFVSKGELDAHTRKHSGAHPFICDDCGNGFTTSSALVKHRRTHTGERPYACDLCPMRFAATGTLKNHRRTHTGERPYQCSHCEKSFVQRSDLISHIRCHTGERPFVCPQCGQAFRKAAAMKAHVKMHSREAQNVMTLSGGLILSSMQCDG